MEKDSGGSKKVELEFIEAEAEHSEVESQVKSNANKEGQSGNGQQTAFQLEIGAKWRDKSHAELRSEIENQLKSQGLSDAPDEFIDQLVMNVSKDLRKRTRWQRFKNLLKTSTIAVIMITFAAVLNLISERAEGFVSRGDLRAALTNAIRNDASFDDVKLVYQQEVDDSSVGTLWSIINPHLYYQKNTLSLLRVLNDLKVVKLRAKEGLEKVDVEFIHRLDRLIVDHNKVNPFDGLDEQSLRDFRGISYKLSAEEYEKVKDELLNLNSAIKQKNSLIGQYLSSSNLSLYVSIAAFIFSVLVAVWQLYPRKASQKQLIAEVVNEHMAKRT